MKFVAISDTHGCHRQMEQLPEGDVLLHAGDVCNRGKVEQAEDFLDWFAGLDFMLKIFISGNHDFDLKTGQCLIPKTLSNGSDYPENMIHLVDQVHVVNGIRIWGDATHDKPKKDSNPNEDWSLVPSDTNILMTHYPPWYILDQNVERKHCGLKGLKKCVKAIQPDVHLFGDVHASYGQTKIGKTQFFNASLYKAKIDSIVNSPFEFEL